MTEDALEHALDIVRIGRPYTHWPASGVISTPYDNPYDPAARFVDFGLARAVAEILNACNEGRLVRGDLKQATRKWTYRNTPWSDEKEAHAQAIYEGWDGEPGYVSWRKGCNSLKQDEARDIVMRAIHTTEEQHEVDDIDGEVTR